MSAGMRAPTQGAAWRLRRAAAIVLIALLAALARAPPAFAHASLLRAEPADGAVVATAPARLRLFFNEPVSPLVFHLVGPDGTSVTPKVTAENATVTVAAPPAMPQGTHVLSWRVISADGHPVGGAVLFSIGAATGPPVAAAVATDPMVDAAIWAVRIAIYVGLFAGVGGAAFIALVAQARPLPGRAERIIHAAMLLGLVAAIISLGLQGLDALALPLERLLDPDAWASGFATSYGWTAALAALAMLIGLATLRVRTRLAGAVLAVGALVLVGAALAASGHASTAAPERVSRTVVLLHGICVAFWVGSLIPLWAIVRAGGHDDRALDRFSRLIPLPLAVLVGTGLYLAWVQLDRPDALWTTAYGEILSGKLLIVLALLSLAAANRFVLVPRLRAQPSAGAPLARSIAAESALVLLLLGAVAGWRFTPPPRALIAAEASSIHFHGGKAMAQIDVEPVRARGAEMSIEVLDGEFHPLAAKDVSILLSNAAAGIEPLRRDATLAQGTTWRIDDLRIPLAGRWSLRVDILVDDFDKETLEDDVLLPKAP
jgi:copper transport protein